MSIRRRWLVTVVACALLLVALASFKYFQIQAAIAYGNSFPEPSETVRALKVVEAPSATYVSTIGEITAPDAVMLRNELEGRITELNMKSGQQINKGDVLLRLDTSEESARLKAARANASVAGLNLKRVEKLLKNNTVSQESVDQAQAQYDIAQANIAELQATIDKKTLTAPFDARVGLHDLEPGEYLGANTALVNLVGVSDHLWVDFNLPLAQGVLAIGDRILVELPKPAAGHVEADIVAKNPALSAQSRNLRYRARLPADPATPPNAVVNILVPTAKVPRIHVPTPAVLRDEMGAYVFRLTPEPEGSGYRAKRQSVSLGHEGEQQVVILKGLKPGMLIATDGAFKLQQDMLAYVGERPARDAEAADAEPQP